MSAILVLPAIAFDMYTREDYLKKIIDTLTLIETSVRNRVVLNLYDNNLFSEDFFPGLLNFIYPLKLENANKMKRNYPGIDLIDTHNKVAYQVTSTNTQAKVQRTIDKFIKKGYQKDFSKLFVLILQPKLKAYNDFNQAATIGFDKVKNIKDIPDLIKGVNKLDTTGLSNVCDFFEKEVKYFNELNHINHQSDADALKNYRSLIKRKALLDPFYLEGSMKAFEEALVEINRAFSIGLIKGGTSVKPIHRFLDKDLKGELDKIQNKFLGLHNLYKLYVKTGEIDPNNYNFFPRNVTQTVGTFDNFREDILKQFNAVLTYNGQPEIDYDFKSYLPNFP
jgi:flavodoxin